MLCSHVANKSAEIDACGPRSEPLHSCTKIPKNFKNMTQVNTCLNGHLDDICHDSLLALVTVKSVQRQSFSISIVRSCGTPVLSFLMTSSAPNNVVIISAVVTSPSSLSLTTTELSVCFMPSESTSNCEPQQQRWALHLLTMCHYLWQVQSLQFYRTVCTYEHIRGLRSGE